MKNNFYYYIIGFSLLFIIFFYPTLINHSLGFIGSGLFTIPLELGIIFLSILGIFSKKRDLINILLIFAIIGLSTWSIMMFSDRNGEYYGGYSIISEIEKSKNYNNNAIIDSSTLNK